MNKRDRNFYILENGEFVPVDMEQRWKDSGGNTNGEANYQYYEMFYCNQHTDSGCDYERNGCQIQQGDVVVDIGGNMGIFARRAWERGASKIISFEPQAKTYECYMMNAKPGMECHNMGISDASGELELTYGESDNNTGGGSMYADYEARGIEIKHREICKVETLDYFFTNSPSFSKVDFLKIDCEGAEGAVLRGISDENLSKFRCIGMELHRSVIKDEERESIVQRFTKLGYLHFALYYGDSLIIYNFWKA